MTAGGNTRGWRPAALLAAFALVVGACSGGGGGDDGEGGDPPAEPTTAAMTVGPGPRVPSEIAPGCGDQAVTDTSDQAGDRVVARCGPGAPEPAPLASPATVRVAVPTRLTEELAPLLVADALGEFEAENLTVERAPLDGREAMDALVAGEVDVVMGRVGGPYLDALHEGSGVQLVLGGVLASAPNDLTVPQSGLWLRRDALGDEGKMEELRLQQVGVPGGIRSAAAYPIGLVLGLTGITLNDVALIDVGGGEAARRLLDGELAAAWLDGGSWLPVADAEGIDLVATLPPGESIDGTVFSERLLGPDRPVGLAFARAIIRTINTHLTGDYRDDGEVTEALAEATGVEADTLVTLPPLLFDWEVRQGTLGRLEDALIILGGVSYDVPLESSRFAERTVAIEAVGGDPDR